MTAFLENWVMWIFFIEVLLLFPGLVILVMIFERPSKTKSKGKADEQATA